MENEQPIEEQPIQEQPVEEQPTTEETTTTTVESSDSQSIELLQSINDTLVWSVAFQVVVMCLLLFNVFFTALKGGKR